MAIARKRWKVGKIHCAYCGVNVATTRDHPVPENLYPLALRSKLQMLVVPACQSCNADKSQVDNALRDYLVIDIDSSQHAIAGRIFEDKMITAASENHVRLLDGFFQGSDIPTFTREGRYDGLAYAIPANLDPVLDAVTWITRALHWQIFDDSTEFTSTKVSLVDRYARLDTIIKMAVLGWTDHFTQGDPFSTAWIVAPSGTVYWAHVFFDSVLFLAKTQTPEAAQDEDVLGVAT